ncbi:MAG: hypothetical protein LUG26_07735 [Ruminococcus sp.]|nr:hypothetical protein [Ruminococcus sp.]
MANIIIKTDERKAYEESVLRSFGGRNNAADREAAQVIAARSQEAIAELKRMEDKRR